MFEKYLVEHCSPTLANLKTANLFRLPDMPQKELLSCIERWNEEMEHKGVSILPIVREEKDVLIYVYRKSRLLEDLKKEGVGEFLAGCGYAETGIDGALERLAGRIRETGGFPHEIGLFLGYPLGDVIGFIENEGKNCMCSGCWKVYCNECEAKRIFERFRKCREIYVRLFCGGRSIGQLTVTA